MAKSSGSLPLLFLLLLLILSFNSGGQLKSVKGMEPQKSWCVAKPSASDEELGSDIEYACKILKDCKMIEEGGPCFNPNTLINHASVVMNQYYACVGRNTWNCDFKNSALIVLTDPSYSSCNYA